MPQHMDSLSWCPRNLNSKKEETGGLLFSWHSKQQCRMPFPRRRILLSHLPKGRDHIWHKGPLKCPPVLVGPGEIQSQWMNRDNPEWENHVFRPVFCRAICGLVCNSNHWINGSNEKNACWILNNYLKKQSSKTWSMCDMCVAAIYFIWPG